MTLADLTRNAVDVLPRGELERKLALGRPLRVKLGIDVTAPDVTLGHAVPLQRMRAFQDEGHLGVLIVGDYTTRIGDPSGRSAERPILSEAEIDRNAQSYFEQASKIIDPDRTEVRFNSEWLSKLDFAEILRLTRTITVARLLERDDFAKRYAAGAPISVSELLYPLMQAFDSVAIEADVELGGTDQLYNLLAGREVMQAEAPAGDPLEAKLELARFIVRRFHGEESAQAAEGHFTRVVREGQAPDEVEEVVHRDDPVYFPGLLSSRFGQSASHWRRVIDQGGVKVDGEPLTAYELPRAEVENRLVQAGKRQFLRLVPTP